jgi:hypothetical protein
MRTLVVLVALLFAGLGLSRLTGRAEMPAVPEPVAKDPEPQEIATRTASFELTLSAAAARVKLHAGGEPLEFQDTAGPLGGRLNLAGDAVFLEIEWADGAAPGHRFARLRLEESGRETREHVFSAAGNIDDLWEP